MPWLTPIHSVFREHAPAPVWGLTGLMGRICEISATHAGVAITVAMGLVLDAQRNGETTAWITTTHSAFFPPDAALLGVDLDALVVVRATHTHALGRAADHLARSGGFGLIVIDLASSAEPRVAQTAEPRVAQTDARHVTLAMPLQSRLLGLAQKHQMALLVLSHKTIDEPSLSSLVSLRGQAQRVALSKGCFRYETAMIKDKQRAPGWTHHEDVDGPPGLR